jgi:predicted nucleic acid-binding protein
VAEEEGGEVVRGAIEGADRVATSTVSYAEARAALARKEREGDLDEEGHRRAVEALDEEWRRYDRLAVSDLVAHRAGGMAERYALRGFDAIHLASAARLRERFDDLRFMAFDRRLTDAARRILPVYEER